MYRHAVHYKWVGTPDDTCHHEFTYKTIIVAPTCETMGYTARCCWYCDRRIIIENTGTLNHPTRKTVVVKEPTYDEDGISYDICTVCNKNLGEYTVPKYEITKINKPLEKIEFIKDDINNCVVMGMYIECNFYTDDDALEKGWEKLGIYYEEYGERYIREKYFGFSDSIHYQLCVGDCGYCELSDGRRMYCVFMHYCIELPSK